MLFYVVLTGVHCWCGEHCCCFKKVILRWCY